MWRDSDQLANPFYSCPAWAARREGIGIGVRIIAGGAGCSDEKVSTLFEVSAFYCPAVCMIEEAREFGSKIAPPKRCKVLKCHAPGPRLNTRAVLDRVRRPVTPRFFIVGPIKEGVEASRTSAPSP